VGTNGNDTDGIIYIHKANNATNRKYNQMKILETERLVIRHLKTDDTAFILELLNEPSFIRNIGDRKVRTEEDAKKYLLNGPIESYDKNGFGLFMVELKDTSVPIGMCGLIKRDNLPDADVGFAFLPKYWMKGYAFESASAVLKYAKETLGLKRILGIVNPDNAASIRVLEKLGLKFESMVKMPQDNFEIKLFAANL
jgi:RimJ/RimL family protein N-acetyltransferase